MRATPNATAQLVKLRQAEALCNRVIVMHKGRFVAEFDPLQTDIEEIQNAVYMAA